MRRFFGNDNRSVPVIAHFLTQVIYVLFVCRSWFMSQAACFSFLYRFYLRYRAGSMTHESQASDGWPDRFRAYLRILANVQLNARLKSQFGRLRPGTVDIAAGPPGDG
jgi:hypothetical protein